LLVLERVKFLEYFFRHGGSVKVLPGIFEMVVT
jgi:hypothetical protein